MARLLESMQVRALCVRCMFYQCSVKLRPGDNRASPQQGHSFTVDWEKKLGTRRNYIFNIIVEHFNNSAELVKFKPVCVFGCV